MARPSFSQQKTERKGGGEPMCLRSSGIPWLKLSLFSLLLKFPMTLFEQSLAHFSCFSEVM